MMRWERPSICQGIREGPPQEAAFELAMPEGSRGRKNSEGPEAGRRLWDKRWEGGEAGAHPEGGDKRVLRIAGMGQTKP